MALGGVTSALAVRHSKGFPQENKAFFTPFPTTLTSRERGRIAWKGFYFNRALSLRETVTERNRNYLMCTLNVQLDNKHGRSEPFPSGFAPSSGCSPASHPGGN